MKKSLFVAGITVFLVVLSFEARADDEDNVEEEWDDGDEDDGNEDFDNDNGDDFNF